ncbi:MAG: outer membrane beta-barrel protein [Burkholderiales bacterium]
MNSCLRKILGISALFTLFAGMSFAQSMHVGIGAGFSHWNVQWENTAVSDSRDPGFKAYMGYDFTDRWGAEVFFMDMGKTYGGGVSQIEGIGYGLSGVLNLRLGKDTPWLLFARAGVANMRGTGSESVSASGSQTSIRPTLGAGVGFEVTKKLVLRGDIDALEIETTDGKRPDVVLFSGGLSIRF